MPKSKTLKYRTLVYTWSLLALLAWSSAFAREAPIGGILVPEEGPLEAGQNFVFPNEVRPFAYDSILKRQKENGLLFCVGSFRCWFDLAMGDFSSGVFIDLDPTIKAFHLANLRWITALSHTELSTSEKRHYYLSALYLASFAAHGSPMGGHRSEWSKQVEFSEKNQGQWQNNLALAGTLLKKFPKGIRKEADEFIKTINSDAPKYLHFMYEYPENEKVFFWASDPLWLKIERLVLEKKIYPVQGDLAGEQTVISIGRALQKQDMPVSVVDISNVLLLLTGEHLQGLIRNLNSLPFTKNPVLLFTEDFMGMALETLSPKKHPPMEAKGSRNRWMYFGVSLSGDKPFLQEWMGLVGPLAMVYSLRFTVLHLVDFDIEAPEARWRSTQAEWIDFRKPGFMEKFSEIFQIVAHFLSGNNKNQTEIEAMSRKLREF